ncbi:MAG: dihydroorotate dehydrogenase [Thermodesulfobacteriota bacterium]
MQDNHSNLDSAPSEMQVDIGGIVLKNPVMTASGTFGYAREFNDLMDLNCLGGIIVKGLSLEPSKGNPPPRIVETSGGMLNAIGLENVGLDAFIKEKLPFLQPFDVPVFANIYGKTVEEYAELALRLNDVEGVAGLEINISCPNVKAGGIAFGSDSRSAHHVVSAVRARTHLPVMVKLSPNVTDVVEIAKSVEAAGADSVSLINTITGMAVDARTRRPILANITGGLSGPAIKPVALRMVWQVAGQVNIPVIGVGGIMNAEDAVEFLIAGACAVQVGTANFINPRATQEIVSGIESYMRQNNIDCLDDLIGSLRID